MFAGLEVVFEFFFAVGVFGADIFGRGGFAVFGDVGDYFWLFAAYCA